MFKSEVLAIVKMAHEKGERPDLRWAKNIPEEIKGLRKLIAETVLANPSQLDMRQWHGEAACGTTHCIAGWACHLAPNGRWIESQLGTASAARFLLGLLGEGEDAIFYRDNDEAIEVLKGWAQPEKKEK